MGYKSGGLSYFEDGGAADEDQQSTTSVQTKPIAAKGKFAMPALAGNVPVNESVLEQMGRLYMQRQEERGGMRGFLNAIKDATAWGAGPEAVLARDKFRQEQEAEDMQFGSQIAQYRSALASQKAFEDRRNKELGIGENEPTATGTPGDMFPMPAQLKQLLANAPRDVYEKEYAKWAQEVAKSMASPEFNKPQHEVMYQDVNGNWVQDTISDYQYRQDPNKYTLASRMRSGEVSGGSGPKVGPADPSAAAPAPLPNAQSQVAAPQGGVQAPAVSPQVGAKPMPAPQGGAQPPVAAPQVGVKPPMPAPQGGAQAPVAAPPLTAPAAPVAPVAPKVGKTPPTVAQAKAQAALQAEVAKEESVGGIKAEREAEKDAQKQFVNDSNPSRIREMRNRAIRVQEILEKDDRIAGLLSQSGWAPAVANLISKGIQIPGGSVGIPQLSDAIAQTMGLDQKARNELKQHLANFELAASQMMNGQGQISDSERTILRSAVSGIDDPAEVIYKTAKIFQARQDMRQKLAAAYSGGKWGRFTQFENSPQAQKILDDFETKALEIGRSEYKLGKQSGATANPKSSEDKLLIDRYLNPKK